MATLAAGSTVSLAIQGHESYTVVSTNNNTYFKAVFTPANSTLNNAGNARTYGPLAQSTAFGPFGVPGTLVLSVDSGSGGSITYTYSSALNYNLPMNGYTWATRPAASSVPVGTEIIVTDIAANGGLTRLYSDGTYWRLYQPLRVSASGVAIPYTGINGDTGIVSYTLPGGLMTPNGVLTIRASLSTSAWTSGTNGFRFNFGGAQSHVYAPTASVGLFIGVWGEIRNRNAQNSQVCTPVNKAQPYDLGGNAFTALAKDTSADTVIAINQVSSATGTNGNVEYYDITVMN